ncbi:hypothetical protein MWU52_04990 [Jannaschia sp. S6380]|uniref:hypothetical protein n=1 Tax=Jannaschia sp. S6380 TaxID=2926408 RepID=UPI001FF66DD6|nr:hypothetical protein [Jannaschia sp. S6380]MCK0166902.1 hypothetical protein [Jannaschia sp. S6380]
MIRVFACLALALVPLLPTAARAETIVSYMATIDAADRRNSRGAPLADPGAILQQDRANYHRFGIRQFGDQDDPFFANRDLRAQIPGLYARGPRDSWSDGVLTGPYAIDIIVSICGARSQPTHLVVNPADADAHPGC